MTITTQERREGHMSKLIPPHGGKGLTCCLLEGAALEAEKKKAESNLSYFGRHTKTFFSFKTQGTTSQISIKDPNAEALVLEGLVLGHPDILRKFNIAVKQDELEKQCKAEKVFKGSNPDRGCTFDFSELAPEVFYMIRRI
jgi:hypothetical protein